MLGPNLGKADQHVTNTAYADIKAICVMCLSHLAPTCKRNTPLQSDNRKLKYLFDSLLPDLIQCPSPNGLRGVTQFQVSKGNLDQLPTLELFEAHAHVSSSLSSYISTFATSCLQIYVPWAIGKAIPWSVHFGWPPLLTTCEPMEWTFMDLWVRSGCSHTLLHQPNPAHYPDRYFEPNEHVSASSRCHLLSIQ